MQSNMSKKNSQYGQAILVGVVCTVLCLMIVPLSPGLLDVLLACNICLSITILILSISITEPMKLSSFPSLLLVTTLFRLGLNVSSTRMILSQAEAGAIIRTFGDYVTGGNLFVGIIIFLVLSIIQFIVIAKGSERVAEVAARFTLDALPGKQMSIDADLRAGLLTSEEAGLRRNALIRESKFYGSMDGAMKFVKGDTIAGFIIVFVNILGGFWAGVVQRGYDLSYAGRLYTVLTVGDGLVAQIPALLIGLSSGFIVTRVADSTSKKSLGSEIGAQLFANPVNFYIVSAITFVLGFVPGFPTFLFMVISFSLAGIATVMIKRLRQELRGLNSVAQLKVTPNENPNMPGIAVPLMLELSQDMFERFLVDERWRVCFHSLYPRMKKHFTNTLGVPFPDLKIAVNHALEPQQYLIKIHEIPVDRGFLSPHHCVVQNNSANNQTILLGDEEKTTETAHGTSIMLLKLAREQEMQQRGVRVLLPEEIVLRHVGRTLKRYASDFVGIQAVRDIVTSVEHQFPELVREVVPRMMTMQKLTDIVKRLVGEGVSIKDFRLILETLSSAHPENKDPVDLTEIVRLGLSKLITYTYAGLQNRLSCFCLDTEIEEDIAKNIQKTGTDCYLTLPPQRAEQIVTSVKNAYRTHRISTREAVVLTSVEIRRYVKRLMEAEMPDLSVLSYQELDPLVVIDQRDTIGV